MQMQIKDLIDFCFQKLPPAKHHEVILKMLVDEETALTVKGINLLKEEHGTRESVETFLNVSVNQAKEAFFLKHFPKSHEMSHS